MIQARVGLPGINAQDVNIEVHNLLLQISDERKEEREEKGKTWHRTERSIGKCSRSLTTPCDVRKTRFRQNMAAVC